MSPLPGLWFAVLAFPRLGRCRGLRRGLFHVAPAGLPYTCYVLGSPSAVRRAIQ